jgi:hypothetical protein
MSGLLQSPFAPLFAEYLTSLAAWRRSRYRDDLRDVRNLRAADALEELAAHVRALPDSDDRLKELSRLLQRSDAIEAGQRTAYELGLLRFYTPETQLDPFLDHLVETARFDANERGRFGGPQVPGDEPW